MGVPLPVNCDKGIVICGQIESPKKVLYSENIY
jgi:hypothetical protein